MVCALRSFLANFLFQEEPSYVILRKAYITPIYKTVIKQFHFGMGIHDFTCKVPLKQPVTMASIRYRNRRRVIIFGHYEISATRLDQLLINIFKHVRINVYQNPLDKHEVPLSVWFKL